MKSNKQRRREIKHRRRQRAEQQRSAQNVLVQVLPLHAIPANHAELRHNNSYGPLPLFYQDLLFTCRDCGQSEVWKAAQQKWWYEVTKGSINSTAVRCLTCRVKERARKAEARSVHLEGLKLKQQGENHAH